MIKSFNIILADPEGTLVVLFDVLIMFFIKSSFRVEFNDLEQRFLIHDFSELVLYYKGWREHIGTL